jgi:hypothetical protein
VSDVIVGNIKTEPHSCKIWPNSTNLCWRHYVFLFLNIIIVQSPVLTTLRIYLAVCYKKIKILPVLYAVSAVINTPNTFLLSFISTKFPSTDPTNNAKLQHILRILSFHLHILFILFTWVQLYVLSSIFSSTRNNTIKYYMIFILL